MGLIQYDERTAAIHELGHALVACCLDVPFEHVEIVLGRKGRPGWSGHCKLKSEAFQRPQIQLDAFQLGGPLAQKVMCPESLGQYHSMFANSVFEHCEALSQDNYKILNNIGWSSDLVNHPLLHIACKLRLTPKDLWGAFPGGWLFDLEAQLVQVLTDPSVQESVTGLSQSLETTKRLAAPSICEAFNRGNLQQQRMRLVQFTEPYNN
jgi:hypothetical protein